MTDLPTERNFPTTLAEMLEFNADAIDELAEQLKVPDRVLPFVGAGLSFTYGLKGWKAYLLHHAKDRGISAEISEMLQKNEYEEAAALLKERMGRLDFQRAIQKEYGVKRLQQFEPKGASCFLHKFTQGPILTTNYDRVIEKTFDFLGLPYEVAIGAQVTAMKDAITKKKRIILKLHGDAEEEAHRILSADDYDRYYGKRTDKGFFDPDKELPQVLTRLMSNTPLLFLGCSLGEDRMLKVLHAISQSMLGLQHYAIVEVPAKETDFQLARTRFSNHSIVPIWYGPEQHHLLSELLEHLYKEMLASTQTQSKPKNYRPKDKFWGRKHQLSALHDWLDGTSPVCSVHGAPGIGKTRFCDHFLELRQAVMPSLMIHRIDLTGVQTATSFLDKLMHALHLPKAAINAVIRDLNVPGRYAVRDSMQEVANQVDQVGGIVYLDNLDEPLVDPQTEQLLLPFAHMRQTRMLWSSRECLLNNTAHNLPLGRLSDIAAECLFKSHWKKSGAKTLIFKVEDKRFIHDKLDNHALSIQLVASQAWVNGSDIRELIEAWNNTPLILAKSGKDDHDERNSLEGSLNLSFNGLTQRAPQSIPLWALTAMFPRGMSKPAQKRLGVNQELIKVLILNNILRREKNGSVHMLAPLRTYILELLRRGEGGLDWEKTLRDVVMGYLLPIASEAQSVRFGNVPDKAAKYDLLLEEFPALAFWVEEASRKGEVWKEKLVTVLEHINDFIMRRPLTSLALLKTMESVYERHAMFVPLANTLKRLGDLEHRLGNPDRARSHYDNANKYFTQNSHSKGLADVSKGLGDLERMLGNRNASKYYMAAIIRYTNLGENLGLAYSLQGLGDLKQRFGDLKKARSLYLKAIKHFTAQFDNLGLANALLSLADLEERLEKTEEAKRLYKEAIPHFINERANLGLGNAFKSLGDLEARFENVKDAQNLLKRAVTLFEEEHDNLGLANALKSIGNLELRLNNYAEARSSLNQAFTHYTNEHSNLGIANTLKSLGKLEIKLGNDEIALKHLQSAVELYINQQEPVGHAYCLASIAKIYHSKGKPSERDQAFTQALQKAKDSNSPVVLKDIQEIAKGWLPDSFMNT